MSDKKPSALSHGEVERGHYGQSALIRYVPEKDPVQDALAESTSTETNKVKMPSGSTTRVSVWDGHGTNEALLRFVMTSWGLIKRLGYWTERTEALAAAAQAGSDLKKAQKELKAAKKEESKILQRNKDDESVATGEAKQQLEEARQKIATAQEDIEVAQTQLEEAQREAAEASDKPFEFFGSNLSQSEQSNWSKIVTEQTESSPYTDVFGKKQEEAPGKTPKSFNDCVKIYLQSRFSFNAAESQAMYVSVGLRKSGRVTVRQFLDRLTVLNDCIEWLPMRYYSPHATEMTTECKKFTDLELVSCILRALPEPWQNDLLKSVHGMLPESTRDLLPLLELIEKSPPTTAPSRDNSRGRGSGGEKPSSGKRHGGDKMGPIPKKPRKGKKHCALCAKHGGKEQTHNTDACKKYNSDGSLKWATKSEGSEKKVKKAFAQLKHKYDENTKTLKKLLKAQSKKEKKRARRSKYDSSDSDTDSS